VEVRIEYPYTSQFNRKGPIVNFAELPASKLRFIAHDTPLVFPVAAIEQHGPHLPVWTDSLILSTIVERAQQAIGEDVIFAPLLWFGNSHHHLDFGGTLSASPRTYLDMINDLIDNSITQGFRRIVFINGHGGNDVPLKQAAFEARQRFSPRHDLLLLTQTYWGFEVEPWGSQPDILQREMGHACEWETSMMLAIRPDLVGDYANLVPVEQGSPFRPGYRAWKTADRSHQGYIGSPHAASEAKGQLLLSLYTAALVDWLHRVVAWDGMSWDS
jgi:creatinine amidohydrolase